MSSVNGRVIETNGREPKFGTATFWTRAIGAVLVAVLVGGGAMLLRHETAIAVNTETVANLKEKIAEVKGDTAEIKKSIGELSRSVRRN